MQERIEALHIVALEIDARKKLGTPDYAEAALLVERAKQIWREQLWHGGKCLQCQKTKRVLEETRVFLLELRRSMGKIQQMKSVKAQYDQVVKNIFEL